MRQLFRLSAVDKQTKAAISYPQRVSLPLSTLRVASLPTLSDAVKMEALKSANCTSWNKRSDPCVRTEKKQLNKQFISLSAILLLAIAVI